MKPHTPPVIFVRRVTIKDVSYYEYFIRQGSEEVNFFLDQESHEALIHAQSEAEKGTQKLEAPFSLRVVGSA